MELVPSGRVIMLRFGSLFPLCGTPKLTGNRGHHCPSNRISLYSNLANMVARLPELSGKGSGFSRFPLLAVGQGESQQPTDSSRFSSRINDVNPSNHGGVGKKQRPARAGLFP
jgi:hypothetical protein